MIGRLLASRRARIGLLLVAVLVLLALLAPLLAPYDPTVPLDLVHAQDLPPSLLHPLGTDFYSRDVLSRVIYGARVSLAIALFAVLLAITVGTAVGVAAGYAGGWLDTVLMRIVDAGLAIPRIFILLVVLALWERVSVPALVVILGLTGWFGTSRIVRAEVQSLREREFVQAARALGARPLRVLARHVLPNVAAPVIVTATLGVGNLILIEAGLSYLGIGVPQPIPSWGSMIRDGHQVLAAAPWIAASAGGAIVVTVLAFSQLGDAFRAVLDPRSRV